MSKYDELVANFDDMIRDRDAHMNRGFELDKKLATALAQRDAETQRANERDAECKRLGRLATADGQAMDALKASVISLTAERDAALAQVKRLEALVVDATAARDETHLQLIATIEDRDRILEIGETLRARATEYEREIERLRTAAQAAQREYVALFEEDRVRYAALAQMTALHELRSSELATASRRVVQLERERECFQGTLASGNRAHDELRADLREAAELLAHARAEVGERGARLHAARKLNAELREDRDAWRRACAALGARAERAQWRTTRGDVADIAALSERGWELVSVDGGVAYFKRPEGT